MKRREFIKHSSMASVILGSGLWKNNSKSHILTFSFDDGFKKSFYKAAEVHEEYGSKACLNVIARGGMKDFKAIDRWILPELLGDFNDWNKLKGRGHEVMPHTWEHLNLTKIPLSQAKENIDKCLSYFQDNLDDYKADEAVYNFAFNASNKELEDYILTKIRAVRTGGWLVFDEERYHELPASQDLNVLGCWMGGEKLIDDYVDKEVKRFLKSDGGWLIFNLHGFDDEGWGPISFRYYDKLLKRLSKLDHVAILPAGEVLISERS